MSHPMAPPARFTHNQKTTHIRACYLTGRISLCDAVALLARVGYEDPYRARAILARPMDPDLAVLYSGARVSESFILEMARQAAGS